MFANNFLGIQRVTGILFGKETTCFHYFNSVFFFLLESLELFPFRSQLRVFIGHQGVSVWVGRLWLQWYFNIRRDLGLTFRAGFSYYASLSVTVVTWLTSPATIYREHQPLQLTFSRCRHLPDVVRFIFRAVLYLVTVSERKYSLRRPQAHLVHLPGSTYFPEIVSIHTHTTLKTEYGFRHYISRCFLKGNL